MHPIGRGGADCGWISLDDVHEVAQVKRNGIQIPRRGGAPRLLQCQLGLAEYVELPLASLLDAGPRGIASAG